MIVTLEGSDFGQPAFDHDELIRAGWEYRDPNTRFSHEMWDLFCSILGKDNYRLLAMTSGADKTGFQYKRGQFLISPEGIQNLSKYAESKRPSPPHASEKG